MTSIQNLILLLFCSCLFASCKTNQLKNGKKTEKWIYKDLVLKDLIISKGRYKHDIEIGTWREYNNKKLVSKKKYKNGICYTTDYHLNGKVRAKGISKVEIENSKMHWFLLGEWKFYDENGNYLGSKFYTKVDDNNLDTLKR